MPDNRPDHIEPSREQRVAELAAEKALSKFLADHDCKFTEHERKVLHAISDEERGVTLETVGTMMRAAKILNETVNQVSRWIVLALFIIVLFFLALIAKLNGWSIAN